MTNYLNMEKERKSTITVRVPVLNSWLDKLCAAYNVRFTKSYTSLEHNGTLGYVDTARGMYVLSDEGVGDEHPLDEAGYEIELFGKGENKEGNSRAYTVYPVCSTMITADDLRDFPYAEVNLASFIRRFGSRLESNFRLWNDILSTPE